MSKPNKQVLIAGYFGFGNTGDEAILSVTLTDLRQALPSAQFTVVSGDPAATAATYNAQAVHYQDIPTLVAAVEEADLVVLGGGGLFQDYWGFDPAKYLTREHAGISFYGGFPLLTTLLNKPLLINAVGVGPLLAEASRQHTRLAFEQASGASVRDSESLELLVTCGLNPTRVKVTADPAFRLIPALAERARALLKAAGVSTSDKMLLGVVLREWHTGQDWVGQVATALDQFSAQHDAQIIFIPFQEAVASPTNDVELAERVRRQLRHGQQAFILPSDLSPQDKAGVLGQCQLVLGMRLHSIIFSAIAHVPVIALSYDPKVRQAMRQLDCSEYAVELEDLQSARLADLLNAAVEQQTTLAARLAERAQVLALLAGNLQRQAVDLLERRAGPASPLSSEIADFVKQATLRIALRADQREQELRAKLGDPPPVGEPPLQPAVGQASLLKDQLAKVINRVGQTRGVVILPPSIPWRIHLFQRPQHLARAFAQQGYLVIYQTLPEDKVEGFEEIEPNLFLYYGPDEILHQMPDPLLWAFTYNYYRVAAYPASARAVYDWIDDLEVFDHIGPEFIAQSHAQAMTEAFQVVTVSRRLYAQALATRPDTLYLPNGVEDWRFADDEVAVPDDPALAQFLQEGKPIAGYYGALAEWFDYELLAAVAAQRPDWNFLLIGFDYDQSLQTCGRRLLAQPNVHWIGSREYTSLPGYLRLFEAALIPFVLNNITRGTSPLKMYEYFAGGKPVIATPLPECCAFPEVQIVRNAQELSQALDRARQQAQDEAFRQRLRRLAQEHSWTQRVQTVTEELRVRWEQSARSLSNQLQTLQAQLVQHEQATQALQATAQKLQTTTQTLQARLAEREQAAQTLQTQLSAQQQHTSRLEIERQKLAQELLAIHHSQYWRWLGYYWRLRHAVRHPRQTLRQALALLRQGEWRHRLGLAAPQPAQAVQPASEPERMLLSELIARTTPPRYDVICFPIIPWGFRFQRPQQLMSQYAAAGHRVFYLAPDFRSSGPPYLLSELGPNLYEVSLRGLARNIYTERLDEAARAELFAALNALRREQISGAAVSFVQLPFWQPLSEQLRAEFAWPIVYDCMDYHAGFSTNRLEMLEAEDRLLATADRVIVSSPFLAEQVTPHNPHTLLLRNACDYAHFAPVAHQPRRPVRPVIGYFGAIADWFDADLVADLAAQRPDWDFVLIGSTFSGDTTRLAHLPNVTLPGEQPYTELPRWLKDFDVAIIPFKRLPLTEATNPVKAYELLAAGKPIVAVPIPEVVALAPLVRLAETPADFEREIAAALAEDSAELVERRRAFARENTWAQRFAALAPTVRDSFPLASIIIVTYNNLALNRLCLESLYRLTNWPNFEVIVVDNGSTDGTPEYLREAERTFPNLRVILNDYNRGFAPANNAALKEARGDYLVLLNNDTVLTPGWLAALIRHLHAQPWLGLVGPVTNAIGNEAKVEAGYEQPEQMFAWAARYVREHDQQLEPIQMLAMFCVGLHREVFERVGWLDEQFAIGMFEDDDYCHRVRLAGYDIRCAHDAFIHHWQRSAFRLLGEAEYQRIFAENLQRYQQKWGAEWQGAGLLTEASCADYRAQLAQVIERAEQSRGAVIFLPSIGWDIVLFQRPHHLARVFARRGYTVIFDCSNVPGAGRGFTEIEPNLWLFHGPEALLYEIPDPLLWAFPYNFGAQARYPVGTRTLYDWIDDLSVFPYSQRLLAANHARALREATVVASVAQRLHQQALAARPDALYLPNGVEVAHFAHSAGAAPDDPELTLLLSEGKPIAGYYGALAEWFDYDLLETVAQLCPDWNFLLIGPKYDESLEGRPLLTLPNVRWLGPRPYESLPHYLRFFDVATIPFVINDITLATSPLKLYEYFAGGKPVVTTPMPECQAFPEVEIAHNALEFAAALKRARARGSEPKFRERLRALAREHSWTARVDAVLELMQKSGAGWEQKPVSGAKAVGRKEASRAASVGRAPSSELTEAHNERNGDGVVMIKPNARSASAAPLPLTGGALEVAERFKHFRAANNQHFFAALARHHAGSPTHPCLPMYFEYAITTNERGRRIADLLGQHVSLRGKRFLDIGCAYGGFVIAFARQGAHAAGIDVNEYLLELARHNLRDQQMDLPLLRRDATQVAELAEFHDSLDIITCNDVIEHVTSPTALLRNIAKLLRTGGVAYFEIPNGKFPNFVRQDGHHQLFGITLLPYAEAAQYFSLHTTGGHVYDVYTYAELDEYTELFAEAGLELTLLEESFQHSNLQTVLADLAELRASAEKGLQQVPAAMRPRVAERLEQYLKEIEAAPRNTPAEVRAFMLRYGVSFWQVLGRKTRN